MDSLRRIVQALRVSSRSAEQELGLSGAQLLVLQTLGKDGSLSINELAERTRTHQSSVSTVVTRLEKSNLVERKTSDIDARRTNALLTPKGKKLLASAPPLAQEKLFEAIDNLSKSEQKELAVLLSKVIDSAGFAELTPSLFFEEEPSKNRKKSGRQSGQKTEQ